MLLNPCRRESVLQRMRVVSGEHARLLNGPCWPWEYERRQPRASKHRRLELAHAFSILGRELRGLATQLGLQSSRCGERRRARRLVGQFSRGTLGELRQRPLCSATFTRARVMRQRTLALLLVLTNCQRAAPPLVDAEHLSVQSGVICTAHRYCPSPLECVEHLDEVGRLKERRCALPCRDQAECPRPFVCSRYSHGPSPGGGRGVCSTEQP